MAELAAFGVIVTLAVASIALRRQQFERRLQQRRDEWDAFQSEMLRQETMRRRAERALARRDG